MDWLVRMVGDVPKAAAVPPMLLAVLAGAAWTTLPTAASVPVVLACLAAEAWFSAASWSRVPTRVWNVCGLFWGLLVAGTLFTPDASLARAATFAAALALLLLGLGYGRGREAPRKKRVGVPWPGIHSVGAVDADGCPVVPGTRPDLSQGLRRRGTIDLKR